METATTEEKFNSAVELIKSLPKSGPVSASNDTKLKFYSYFKQATEGPCELPRPSFWDVINRAKWDAWNKLGNMSKQDAMKLYVDAFTEIIKTTPIDTLDDPEVINDYVNRMGPYISLAPKALQEKHMKMNGDVNKPYNKADAINGHTWHVGNESDNEEFSDTLEGVNDEETHVKGPLISESRGGGDPRHRPAEVPRQGTSATTNQPTANTGGNNLALPLSLGGGTSGGAGGARRGNDGPQTADAGEQIALALLRMQHTMEQVVARLDALEASLLHRTMISKSKQPGWKLFGIPSRVLIPFLLAWPFVAPFLAQWIIRMIRKNQQRR